MPFPPHDAVHPLSGGRRRRPILFGRLANPLSRVVIVASAALIAAGAVLHVANLKVMHDDALATAEGEMRNLAHVLADHTARVFESADRGLFTVVDMHRHIPVKDAAAAEHVHNILKTIQGRAAGLTRVSWADRIGRRIGSSEDGNSDPPNVADQEFFRVHTVTDDLGLFIGKPYKPGGVSGPWAVAISRRLNQPDGSFDGVAVGILDPYYFADFYQSMDFGTTRRAALITRDGTILSRAPDADSAIGHSLAQAALFREQLPTAPNGTFSVTSRQDQVTRIVSYATVKGYPLVVTVGIGEDEALAGWRHQRLFTSLAFAAFVGLYLLVARLLIHQLERDEAGRRTLDAARREAVESNRAKSAFLSHMSHELRTPLNAILGFAELIRDRMDPRRLEANRNYATEIHNAGTHLLELINDVLDFAKIEARRRRLEETTVDLPSLVEGVIRLHGPAAERAGVALAMSLPADLPALLADERAIVQMLNNLVTNALKFTPSGGRVEIRAANGEAGLTLAVCDTGIGIAPEDQRRVFERFAHSTDPLVSSPQGGTGLGLAIVKGLIELHGGRVRLISAPGEGTTVELSFPVLRVLGGRAAA